MWLKLFVLGFISVVASEKVRYDNYTLYKVHPQSDDHVTFLKDLQNADEELDFWKPASYVGDYVSVVSPPEKRGEFEESLKKMSIYSEVMLENIQEAFDAQLYSRRKRSSSNELYWTNYQTYDEVKEWFEHLAKQHSDIVTLINSGNSFEGRSIIGVKIARGKPSRAFILQGGEIGADWLSPTVMTYVVDQLVKGEDPEAKKATEDFEWHIFPFINPDGFQFTQDSVRLWTKNRRPIRTTAESGIGVDLSKNWNSQWGVSGGSHSPSASNFIGIGPFSEVETRQFSRYIDTIAPRLAGFLSFRAFGQRLVLPFAHMTHAQLITLDYLGYKEMITIGRRAMGSLSVKYDTQYRVGTSKDVLDGATGSMVDWVKHRFNTKIATTYFLRDEGEWGYTLPVAQITPSCEETFDSLMAILREAKFINVL